MATRKIKGLPEVDRRIVRRAFQIKHIRDGFAVWFDNNLVYCQDTHSFVHRVFLRFKGIRDSKKAKHEAFLVIEEMQHDYLSTIYNKRQVQELIVGIKYVDPLKRLKDGKV
jgi:hypothetical protein